MSAEHLSMPDQPFWEAEYRDHASEPFGTPSTEIVALADAVATNKSVLDIGCGDGRHALFLASRGFRVRAFDVSSAGIAKLRERASSRKLEVDAWVDDAATFVPDRPYDIVIAHGVLHLLDAEACDRLLTNLKRKAPPDAIHVHTVFTDSIPAPPDLAPHIRHLFREGEIGEMYADWQVEQFESYVKEDEHPGGVHHRHAINKLVARKPPSMAAV